MDVHAVRLTQADINRVNAEALQASATGFTAGDACTAYKAARPFLMIAITILTGIYKPGADSLTAVVAILDAACQ